MSVTNLLLGCTLLITLTGFFAYRSEKQKNKDLTIMEFLSIHKLPSMKSLMVGMSSNIVFGIIDNGGLFFGMDALDPYLPSGNLTKAGLGNTFSDGLGAFLGTFAGIIIKNAMNVSDDDEPPPIWSEFLGIVIGCLLGLYISKLITGKK